MGRASFLLVPTVVLLAACGGSGTTAGPAASGTTTPAAAARAASPTMAAPKTTAAPPAAAGKAGAVTVLSGKVGDRLVTDGFRDQQERVAVRVTEIVDPANSTLTAERYKVEPNQRAVIVKSEFTNLGPNPYKTTPDLYLVVVDDRGQPLRKSIAVLRACPSFPSTPVPPGGTVTGCTVYQLAQATPVASVQWSPRPDLTDRTLTWKR